MSKTVKDICDFFFNLEDKYSLNFKEIQGTYFWQLIRIYLYYDISKKLNVFESAQQSSLSLFDKIKSFVPFIKNSFLNNPFKGDKKDILIFDHPRKTIFNDKYYDIYSYFLVDYFLKENMSFEVMESPYLNEHFSDNKNYIKYSDKILLSSYIYKKFNKINFTNDELELINNIEKEFKKEFDIDLNLKIIIENHILNFKHDYNEYLKLFKLKQPKQIFVVVAYENNAVVKAAKDLNIEVIEIQHGTISKYHLGYSYPNKTRCFNGKLEEIAYFPDKLLSFGDYWNNSSYFPISREHIISIGFPYFESNTKNYMGVNKESNKILFISQGVIGKYLSKFAFELGEKLDSYEIIYKLHPGEYSSWRENYKYLLDASKLDNFKVIDNNNTPLYQLFAESNYQIGVFSTAIYEGLSFNCKTFVLDFPGVEYLDDLVDEGFICKINSVNELIQNIETFAPKNYNKDFFFKKYDENVLKNIIK